MLVQWYWIGNVWKYCCVDGQNTTVHKITVWGRQIMFLSMHLQGGGCLLSSRYQTWSCRSWRVEEMDVNPRDRSPIPHWKTWKKLLTAYMNSTSQKRWSYIAGRKVNLQAKVCLHDLILIFFKFHLCIFIIIIIIIYCQTEQLVITLHMLLGLYSYCMFQVPLNQHHVVNQYINCKGNS